MHGHELRRLCENRSPIRPHRRHSIRGQRTWTGPGSLILDDSDAYGVEMALQLVDKAGEGEVTLVSMAPNGETSGLRTALAMGALPRPS